MNNPVRHGLVQLAEQYRFCSAGWFRKNSSSAFFRKVASFKYDLIEEPDEFKPVGIDTPIDRISKAAEKLPHPERANPPVA